MAYKSGSVWRDKARPIIAKVIKEWDGVDERDLSKALYYAYPFGERKYHPYKVWLSEIALQRGKTKKLGKSRKKKKKKDLPFKPLEGKQLELF